MPSFLVIQTAFIGDVVLATAVVEKLRSYYPDATIDFLLRKGNEGLLQGSQVSNILIWDKKANKTANLYKIIKQVRRQHYTHVINLHRFASSGIVTALSGAPNKIGFDKNPLSFTYTKKVKHIISAPYDTNPIHETGRNQMLIADITDPTPAFPKLYLQPKDEHAAAPYKTGEYICISPASVWFTKQFPKEKWVELINLLPAQYNIYLLGGPGDSRLAEELMNNTIHENVQNLCGKLSFLSSAALMKDAVMNYVNDSGPLHFAGAVNAPVTAVFCSTVPAFGFGPVRENGHVVEIAERLYCRPCGLHGHKECPQGHFRCAKEITNDQLLWWTSKTT